jgi:translation elongation factor EF-4
MGRGGAIHAADAAGIGAVAGDVDYFTVAIKTVVDARVGDTVTTVAGGASLPLPGYRAVKPMVFARGHGSVFRLEGRA